MNDTSMPQGDDASALLESLWQQVGGDADALSNIAIEGAPVLPTSFRVADMASATIAATGLSATGIHQMRGGESQQIRVDTRHAEIAYLSERYLEVEGDWPDHQSPTWGYYRTKDDRWVQVHTTFPHHQAGAAALLQVEPTRSQFAAAIANWSGVELEDTFANHGLPCTLMRSRPEWLAHPQGAAVAELPLMDFEKIGDAPAGALGPSERPMSGINVLDLTRVIAGPVAGRTMAEHGANVLRIASPNLPFVPRLVIDSGRGKRSAHIDLNASTDRTQFEQLIDGADIMVQGYRPGAIGGLGYTPHEVAKMRPGIVYVSLCAFSHAGPWAGRRGFDSLVQIASGIAKAGSDEAGRADPVPLPCQALDHATGYLAALGAMMGLQRQWREGGSWHVRVSLAQTAEWLARLGRIERRVEASPARETISDLMDACDSPFGRTEFIKPVAQLSATPGFWATPAVPLGTHPPTW